MRCNICNKKLNSIREDSTNAGGFAPCGECNNASFDANFDDGRLYDDSDPTLDIDSIVHTLDIEV